MNELDLRKDFPFFLQKNAPIYLDSAATAQKPKAVIERIASFYASENANIHRGDYPLAAAATCAYEQARADIATFIGAKPSQIAFTHGATDALNQAASMLAPQIRSGSQVVVTALEHNSALLPFMRICEKNGAILKIIPIAENGVPRLEMLDEFTERHTAAAVITAGASATGWRTPLHAILPLLSKRGIPVVLDASQRILHERIDFMTLPCDFLCFSGHKLYGPMGIGVLAMKEKWLQMAPARVGGGTVRDVREDGFILEQGIEAFEAGTPSVAQALGLQSAVNYLLGHDMRALFAHEASLTKQLINGLSDIPGVRVVPAGEDRLPIAAFVADTLHPVDMAHLLAARGIALRCGRHCAHIAHRQLGLEATLRASIGIYTTEEDINALLNAVEQIQQKWRRRHGSQKA